MDRGENSFYCNTHYSQNALFLVMKSWFKMEGKARITVQQSNNLHCSHHSPSDSTKVSQMLWCWGMRVGKEAW